MKIALDATYSQDLNPSGVGVYSRELLSGLTQQNPEVDWRFLYRPHRIRRALKHPISPAVTRGLLLDRALWRSIPLFHGLNQRLPLSRFPRQVTTFHDLFVLTGDYSTPEFRKRFARQARHAAVNSDHMIAVSQFTKDQLVSLLNADPLKITVVHHGVKLPRLPTAAREKIILHVGAVQKRKNLIRLIQAFASVPQDWRLVLAGSNGYGSAQILHTVNSSPARDRIVVSGYVDELQLSNWYAKASIFAFPSLDEGFGMPVLEAMAAGVPVLTSNTSSLREVSGDAALLIDPRDHDELSKELIRLCSDEHLRRDLAIAGTIHAASFSWETAAQKTFDVYRSLL